MTSLSQLPLLLDGGTSSYFQTSVLPKRKLFQGSDGFDKNARWWCFVAVPSWMAVAKSWHLSNKVRVHKATKWGRRCLSLTALVGSEQAHLLPESFPPSEGYNRCPFPTLSGEERPRDWVVLRLAWRISYLTVLRATFNCLDRFREKLRPGPTGLFHLYTWWRCFWITRTGRAVVMKFLLKAGPAGYVQCRLWQHNMWPFDLFICRRVFLQRIEVSFYCPRKCTT